MKKRFANSRLSDVEKEFFVKRIDEEYFKGNICLLKLNRVENPWYVKDFGKIDCIVDNNYKWLEIYPDNEKYAITAMYNDKNELIEWYFDMAKNIGKENGIPYIDDLYLDLVIKQDGTVVILDENELEAALKTGDITEEDFELAYNTMRRIKSKYVNNLDELYDFTNKLYKMFYEVLNNK